MHLLVPVTKLGYKILLPLLAILVDSFSSNWIVWTVVAILQKQNLFILET